MHTSPLVSINIPTYNQAAYIARAIESALAQDYANLQIVVSDDCSTDGTFEIAQRYVGRGVQVHRTSSNLGRVANYRHLLYQLSSGVWAINLDGDDYYDDPSFIGEAVAALNRDPSVVMCAAGARSFIESSGQFVATPMAFAGDRVCMQGVDFVLAFPSLGATQHFSVLYNRALAMETDFYSLDSLGTDTDSLLRLALRGNVHVHRKYVGVWTEHANNASYTLNDETLTKELRMLENVARALAHYVPERTADQWLERQVEIKKRLAASLTLRNMPLHRAFSYYAVNAKPNLFYLKEGAKLGLRSLGLR